MSGNAKRTAGADSADTTTNQVSPTNKATAVKRPAVGGKRKAVRVTRSRKASEPTARTKARAQKLICRYCGSDDLAPSFRKRRDARCRACFKQRYGTESRGKGKKPVRRAPA
jgi:hypothetical protein